MKKYAKTRGGTFEGEWRSGDSVGAKTEGMGCIEFDDYHAMSQMVRHVICEHGARKLAYIDGPKEYSDAAKEHRHTKMF